MKLYKFKYENVQNFLSFNNLLFNFLYDKYFINFFIKKILIESAVASGASEFSF